MGAKKFRKRHVLPISGVEHLLSRNYLTYKVDL
jgi:hypothetical protein